MLLSEYIKMLTEFLASNEDLPVEMTESGYYSGNATDAELLVPPEKRTHKVYVPNSVTKKYEYVTIGPYYSLGHSHQSY